MTDLIATPGWDSVPLHEESWPLKGGTGGHLNLQAQALLNRSEQAKNELAALQLADYTALRAYAGPRKAVYVIAPGIAGMFVRDDADTTTADNGGTVIVAGNGRRWKRQFDGAIKVQWFITGDGVADDTAKLQACYAAHPGAAFDHGSSLTILVSGSITVYSNSRYFGASKIKAKNGANISGAMLSGIAVSNVVVDGLELDANKANTGARYGVWLVGGTRNFVRNAYVHDTIQAGAVLEGESGSFVEGGYYLNCGANTGTDNHGIMVISTAATTDQSGARFVRVNGAYRKGITGYTGVGGSNKHLAFEGNMVSGCGLSGLYVANAPGATDQDSVYVGGNICWDNYVNFEFDNIRNLNGGGNISRNSTAQGVVLRNCTSGVIAGFEISDSGAGGLQLNSCSGLAFGVVNIRNSNRTSAGFGPGLALVDSTFCTFASGSQVYDETPLTTHGVIEQGACDNNDFDGISVTGVTAALYTIVGGSTRVRTKSGRNTGFGAVTPLNTVHIDGGISVNDQTITLSSGVNNDVALPAKAGALYVSGPTGAYSITGIAGGHKGRQITIFNYTTYALTVAHNSGLSSAGSRILVGGAADLVVAAFGCVQLRYYSGANAWVVEGTS